MNILSREEFTELVDEANIKPRLQRELRFVPEEIVGWQDRDFLAVMNRSRSEGVLLVPLDRMYVVPFQLHARKPGTTGRTEAIICDFCKTWQRGSNSAVITFQKKHSTVTYLCCADLDCSLHVRDKTVAAKISRTQLREHMTIEQRIERSTDRIQEIVRGLA